MLNAICLPCGRLLQMLIALTGSDYGGKRVQSTRPFDGHRMREANRRLEFGDRVGRL